MNDGRKIVRVEVPSFSKIGVTYKLKIKGRVVISCSCLDAFYNHGASMNECDHAKYFQNALDNDGRFDQKLLQKLMVKHGSLMAVVE